MIKIKGNLSDFQHAKITESFRSIINLSSPLLHPNIQTISTVPTPKKWAPQRIPPWFEVNCIMLMVFDN